MNKGAALMSLDKVLRGKHYSKSTRKTYGHWVRRYCQWLERTKPTADSTRNATEFLSMMAAQNYSASSQNQAFNAASGGGSRK